MFEKQTGPTEVLDKQYSYDDAGNLTRIADSPGSATPNDTQCFRYDYLRRTTDAWTPLSTAEDNCEANPGPQGGVARYRFAWQYDATGNRVRQAQYSADGGYTDYEYPEAGQDRPHALTGTVKSGPQGTETTSYAYDDAGHMTERVVDGNTQTIGWTIEGKVDEITGGQGSTEFLYDADGDRLIRRTPDGATLYLGNTEVEYTVSDGQTSATRYYTHGGATVAVRTEDDVYWMVNDHHQTGAVAIRESDMTYQHRRTTPFGDTRGTAPAWWPGDKGFVGGTDDPTGLTHLGARMYDSALGRFISVDPIIDISDPQQMNGYAYSNNSPATFTDPDGLKFCESMNCDMPGEGYVDGAGNAYDRGGKKIRSAPTRPRPPSVDDVVAEPYEMPSHEELAYELYGTSLDELDAIQITNLETFAIELHNPQARPGGDFDPVEFLVMEIIGVQDFVDCADAKVSGCAWALSTLAGGAVLKSIGKVFRGIFGGARASAKMPTVVKVAEQTAAYCSFDGDEEVIMADGTSKPISEVEIGDVVLASDPESGERGERTVTMVWDHEDVVLDFVMDDGSVIATTVDHSFWNATDQAWQRADQIDDGDELVTETGEQLSVHGVAGGTGRAVTAYNLTVEGIHTYYIRTGDRSVLVHNTKCGKYKHAKIEDMAKGPNGTIDLPNTSGVYQLTTSDGAIYVGKASDLHD
jgi:RHS repeat-associated protein